MDAACVASMFGQEQPRPAKRDRHERGAVGIDAVLPLLAESEALMPGHRGGGVGDAEDRDDFLVHGLTFSLTRLAAGAAGWGVMPCAVDGAIWPSSPQ
jgi:hypothetical protein